MNGCLGTGKARHSLRRFTRDLVGWYKLFHSTVKVVVTVFMHLLKIVEFRRVNLLCLSYTLVMLFLKKKYTSSNSEGKAWTCRGCGI